MKPLRSRGLDLAEKLETVRSQLLSARNGRERSLSLSSLGQFSVLSSLILIHVSRYEELKQAGAQYG